MNVVVGSSRAFNLKPLLPAGTKVQAIPSAKLKALTTTALSITPPSYSLNSRAHVYFICGIPDISELVQSPKLSKPYYAYAEAIYIETPELTIERYKKDLIESQKTILKHGALPIFATIPSYNIETYNNYLLTKKRKTKILYHQDHYSEMQENLELVIITINKFITELNKKVGASTPFLHDTIRENRGTRGSRYSVYNWSRLFDGLHAGPKLTIKWAKVISKCIDCNQKNEEEEVGSPKRSWKKHRFA